MERNRPQFPEPPHRRRRTGRTEPGANALLTQHTRTELSADAEQSERQPLLSAAALARHGAVGMEQASGDTWHSSADMASHAAVTAQLLRDPPPPYS